MNWRRRKKVHKKIPIYLGPPFKFEKSVCRLSVPGEMFDLCCKEWHMKEGGWRVGASEKADQFFSS